MKLNPLFRADFYKIGHVSQYHEDVRQVFSTWTPRSSRVPGVDKVVNFGLTMFLKEYVIKAFNDDFFARPKREVVDEYRHVIGTTLFRTNVRTDHIEALHDYGRLPLTFYSLPEGVRVPLNTPPIIVKNTNPGPFFWVTNYIETLMSNVLWKPMTSATTARRFREIFMKHARRSGEKDFGFVDWQGHDFSYRGMSGDEDAMASGLGHLLMFTGTDTIPAILAAEHYYGAKLAPGAPIIGGSVAATEHSVACASIAYEGELGLLRRLLTEVYPTGVLSFVSDTMDLWKVLTEYIPACKDILDVRDGKLVVRPDSGDPVKIMCGDRDMYSSWVLSEYPPAGGVLRLLAKAMGTHSRENGKPLIGKPHPIFLNTGAAIYGDSISPERADEILTRCIDEIGLSPYNCVFGIGSYTYAYVTRDTYGFAMKATAYKNRAGEIVPIFKKPVTDDGGKFSHKGIVAVYDNGDGSEAEPDYVVRQNADESELDNCAYQKVFEDGTLLIDPDFETIRKRARAGI